MLSSGTSNAIYSCRGPVDRKQVEVYTPWQHYIDVDSVMNSQKLGYVISKAQRASILIKRVKCSLSQNVFVICKRVQKKVDLMISFFHGIGIPTITIKNNLLTQKSLCTLDFYIRTCHQSQQQILDSHLNFFLS